MADEAEPSPRCVRVTSNSPPRRTKVANSSGGGGRSSGSSVCGKTFNDPIHGHIFVPQHCIDVIDTAEFQRLRDLSQLGTSSFVFPGARQSRFEHSLGVAYLAGRLGTHLRKSGGGHGGVHDRDLTLLQVAGLGHDLGHGPFSHVFESWVKSFSRIPDRGSWSHEAMSCDVLERLIDANSLDYDRHEVRFMQALIRGDRPPEGSDEERMWLFDVIHNKRNGIDVDKFDYLARDGHMLGVRQTVDYTRLLNMSKVIGQEVCFHRKEVLEVYELLHTRYTLHKLVYSHRVGKAIELMLADAFRLADPVLCLSERLLDPASFCSLTDGILREIEFSKDPRLAPSQTIINAIRRRKLYKMAVEALLLEEPVPALNAEQLVRHSDGNLTEEDAVVLSYSLDYAMGSKNPVDSVHFFDNWDSTEAFSIDRRAVSLLIPERFEEHYLRVFCRDRSKVPLAQEAFARWQRAINLQFLRPPSTPTKHK